MKTKSVSCSRCGQEWPRDPALEVKCPTCQMPVGRKCRRPSEHNVWGGELHAARDQAAMDAGLLKKCTGKTVANKRRRRQVASA